MASFEEVRDKFVELCTKSVEATESKPERIQGCLDGLALCKKMTSIEEIVSEIECRKPELDLLRRQENAKEYWAFRCADAQLEWFLQVMAAGCGSLDSARASMFYQRIVSQLNGGVINERTSE